ncbi:nuclear transport factor 2 family protein [Saccharothrix syringae]|uniref:Nuclear transport factor 2 family protein n=1 Tax=Saccharothrix syringae TaxID=103733 RepID=A0A5Q0H422_SACSY|nr:nuclear transport factor 2 family protein [Saccharothrix syringae]QFZ20961.1 nuclear transport factor 2 family protein [Saccharothrix syringae]
MNSERNVATMRRYFELLSRKDFDGWLDLWADDGVQFIPYHDNVLPPEVRGKAELGRLYREIHESYSSMVFTNVDIHAVHGADRVFARWHPVGQLLAGGEYENDSIGLFDFDADGKIVRYTEWFSPLGFSDSFEVTR